jgi:hypothetical protein
MSLGGLSLDRLAGVGPPAEPLFRIDGVRRLRRSGGCRFAMSWKWLFSGDRDQWLIVILISTAILVLGEIDRSFERSPDTVFAARTAK